MGDCMGDLDDLNDLKYLKGLDGFFKGDVVYVNIERYNEDISKLSDDDLRYLLIQWTNESQNWIICSKKLKCEIERINKLFLLEISYRKSKGINIKPITLMERNFPKIGNTYYTL
ncbi:MAG: hypothetical protein MJZ34_07045 [Paludibacteraceae bacterium]|nr:hypothetical protein [Paludibacteraceae bacterium]